MIQLSEEGRWVRVVVEAAVPMAVLMPPDDYRGQRLRIGDPVCLICPPEAVSLI